MLRRWYVVIICLALTAGGAYAMSQRIQAAYQSTATVVLLPPSSVVTSEGNPYLFMGGLDQALTVLVVKLNSAEVAEMLIEGSETYAVEKDPSGPGPLINITAEAATGPGSQELRDDILDRLPNDLQELQAELGVASNSQIGVMTVVQSDEPERSVKEQMRAVLGVAAVGMGLAVWLTGLFDRWMLARAAKRREERDEENVEKKDRKDSGSMDPAALVEDFSSLLEESQIPVEYVSGGQP